MHKTISGRPADATAKLINMHKSKLRNRQDLDVVALGLFLGDLNVNVKNIGVLAVSGRKCHSIQHILRVMGDCDVPDGAIGLILQVTNYRYNILAALALVYACVYVIIMLNTFIFPEGLFSRLPENERVCLLQEFYHHSLVYSFP